MTVGVAEEVKCDICDVVIGRSDPFFRHMCSECFDMGSEARSSLKMERLYFPTLWKIRKEGKNGKNQEKTNGNGTQKDQRD